MNPLALAGPAVEPVSLAEMKAYLRLDTDDEDALVAGLIAAARLAVERRTRLVLIAQAWRYRLDRWPSGRSVALPLAPVSAITAVRVQPASGPATALDPALYRLDASREPPRLIAEAGAPDPGIAFGGIEIDATYGFGPSAEAVPAPLRLAIQRLAAHWFESRGDGPDHLRGDALPGDLVLLLSPYTRARLA